MMFNILDDIDEEPSFNLIVIINELIKKYVPLNSLNLKLGEYLRFPVPCLVKK